MKNKPLVSVIVPVYNKVSTIFQSIESIFDQSYGNFEIVVVDDCSTDDSRKMIDGIKEPRLKKIYLVKNSGVAKAYEAGFKKAKGKYIFIQDSDDMSLPDRIEKCIENIGDADMLYHGIYLVSRHPSVAVAVRRYHPPKPYEYDRIFKEQYIPGVFMGKTSFFKKVKIPKEAYGAWDWMHHILLHQMGAKYKVLNEGLYEYYRFINSSLSHANEMSGKRQESIKWIQEYLKQNKLIPKNHKFGHGFSGKPLDKPNVKIDKYSMEDKNDR